METGASVLLLVNPSARRVGRHRLASAVSVLESRCRVEVRHPASAPSMADAARDGVRRGVAAVVVAGGDGSVNCAAAALVDSAVPLGILPLGTGNDFARALGLPPDGDEAARRILSADARAVDVVRVNDRVFCTAGVLGVPAEAALTVRRWLAPGRPLLHVLGRASYTLAGLRHLLRPGELSRTYRIEPAPTGAARGPACQTPGLFFANTRMLGGGLSLPVPADPADGQMDIVAVAEMPRLRLLWAFVCFARGWRLPPDAIESVRTARATVRCEEPTPFSADGDLLEEAERFALAVAPGALRVLA